jgi:hypothetical protein
MQQTNRTKTLSLTHEYWTEERLKTATPISTMKVSDEQLKRLMKDSEENLQVKSKAIESAGQDITTTGVPERANVSERPFWNGGKLYFTKPNGKNYICSAQFTGQNNILLTAAHCVRDGNTGEFYKNFIFYRAYNNGGGQKVGWECAMAYYMWANPPMNFKYDYAFIHTNTTSGAGWLGMVTQIPFNSFTAIGYPENYGNNQYMYKVQGNKGSNSGGVVEMTGNPMRSGNSGGAWIGDLTTPHVGGNYAIGLNSFHNDAHPNSEFGPLFDDQTLSLYQKTVNNCTE